MEFSYKAIKKFKEDFYEKNGGWLNNEEAITIMTNISLLIDSIENKNEIEDLLI